jgi:hypothetical protein
MAGIVAKHRHNEEQLLNGNTMTSLLRTGNTVVDIVTKHQHDEGPLLNGNNNVIVTKWQHSGGHCCQTATQWLMLLQNTFAMVDILSNNNQMTFIVTRQ